ncbi:MAG: hypothetical protein AABX19_01425 [Nanoarchaeota archaeon]
MIILSIWLYGKPSWDIPIEGKSFLDPRIIREHNEYLYSHLNSICSIIEKLNSNGWNFSEVYGEFYAIVFYKNISYSSASKEVSSLDIPYDKIVMEEIR